MATPASSAADRWPLEQLTDREREALIEVGCGHSNDEIAARLHMSPATARTHVSQLLTKLHARDRSQLAALAPRYSSSESPAAIIVALAFNLCGFLLTVLTALGLSGDGAAPSLGTILEFAGWVALATIAVSALRVGVASLTGSLPLTLTALIAWQTVASTLLYSAVFLGPVRKALLAVALGHLRPGPAMAAPTCRGPPTHWRCRYCQCRPRWPYWWSWRGRSYRQLQEHGVSVLRTPEHGRATRAEQRRRRGPELPIADRQRYGCSRCTPMASFFMAAPRPPWTFEPLPPVSPPSTQVLVSPTTSAGFAS